MIQNFLKAWLGIFVAQDILGVLPFFVSLMHPLTVPERHRLVNRSLGVAGAVALMFVLLGESFFRMIGIELLDFKIAGGIVLLLIALYDLLNYNHPDSQQTDAHHRGIVPLGVPLITGPAVITTVVLQVSQWGYGVVLVALGVNYGLAWFLLRNATKLTRYMGREGCFVISKIAALLVAAIGVAMIRGGIMAAIEFI